MAGRPELAVVVIGLQAPAELVLAIRSVLDQTLPLGREHFPVHADHGGLWMADVSANVPR